MPFPYQGGAKTPPLILWQNRKRRQGQLDASSNVDLGKQDVPYDFTVNLRDQGHFR